MYKDADGQEITDGTSLSGEVAENAGSAEITNAIVRSKLKILKVDKQDGTTTLQDAVFVLQNDQEQVCIRTSSGWTDDEAQAQRFTTNSDGIAEVGELERASTA